MKHIFSRKHKLTDKFISEDIKNKGSTTYRRRNMCQRSPAPPVPGHKGKYFGQKFEFFPHLKYKNCEFLPCFVEAKITQMDHNLREAPKFWHFCPSKVVK